MPAPLTTWSLATCELVVWESHPLDARVLEELVAGPELELEASPLGVIATAGGTRTLYPWSSVNRCTLA